MTVWFLLLPLPGLSAPAETSYDGLRLEQAIARLDEQGLQIVYSSDLIKPWMRVRGPPAATDPRGILAEILQPYDLGIEDGPAGTVIVVRRPVPHPVGTIRGRVVQTGTREPVAGARLQLEPGDKLAITDSDGSFAFLRVPPGRYRLRLDARGRLSGSRVSLAAGETRDVQLFYLPEAPPDLAEVVVNASRYDLLRDTAPSVSAFSAADLEVLPEIGDDGLRAVARLPGTAGIDISAKSNVRGGEVDETLVRFDGLRLYNPFHLKDFQSLFSAIDPSLIEKLNIFTGGFPVTYGDRMSSVIDITPLAPGPEPYREVTLSFFNASVLATDSFNDEQSNWLVAARRGNLDLVFDVLDPDRGNPQYMDLYTRLGHRFSDKLSVSANLLAIDDKIKIFEDDKNERARANYSDEYYWLKFDLTPTESLDGDLLLGYVNMHSKRRGEALQEGIATGTLYDRREFDVLLLQTDWSWRATDRLLLQAGGEFREEEGKYFFQDQAQFGLLFDTPGAPTEPVLERDLQTSPSGQLYGLYGNLRVDLLDWLTTEVGLRWDRETLSPRNDNQFSPRTAMMLRLGERTRLRFSWGRFFQAQAINELQISDGVTQFFPAQQADHWIGSLEHNFPGAVDLRVELFRKEYDDPRPRFENLLNWLILLPEIKPDRIRIAPRKATAEGIEISLSRVEARPFSWWASYTWSSIKDDFGAAERPRAWDQTYAVNGGVAWRTERWELSLAGTYHRGWPTTDTFLLTTDPLPVAGTGTRNGQRMNDFRSVDLRVARRYELGDAGRLTVFGQVNNLFNWQNNCCIDYEIEESETSGELLLDLENKHGLPIVPSLGVTWQF